MESQSVQEQLRQGLMAQIEPQGWHLQHMEEQDLAAHHSYLLMQPHKRSEVYAVYVAAFTHGQAPGFLNCCKVYVFKDGRALPLEWWGRWQ
jgi:hypothetical protein